MSLQSLSKFVPLFALFLLSGCGDNPVGKPKALTEEQKKAIKAEDEAVANEEGGRVTKKQGKK